MFCYFCPTCCNDLPCAPRLLSEAAADSSVARMLHRLAEVQPVRCLFHPYVVPQPHGPGAAAAPAFASSATGVAAVGAMPPPPVRGGGGSNEGVWQL